MSSGDLIDLEDSASEKQEYGDNSNYIPTEEPIEENDTEKPEDSETMKSMKKGAGLVGGFFKKGWGAVKTGAAKANEKFKETDIGKKTVAEVDKFKQTEFAQKVAEGAKKTGTVIKDGAHKVKESEFAHKVAEGAKKTGTVIKEGAHTIKEKSAPALEKAKENMVKLGQDIKASIDANNTGSSSSNRPEEP